ncbi:hypothetical protein Nepgr_024206 [Nepenthes gracilis]|uniref:Phytocyanin domain-containing protein n=1 Tax=Nepenthes gracilis TaxID=150966 RepID=A0AAD3XYK4_NEPGR|nr:hypothetical protein Nepgr_024206 [Nepenthes gracilis]
MGIADGVLLILLLAAAAAVAPAYGAQTYSVVWGLGNDYSSWASKTINVGDTIVFNYDSSTHDVVSVDKSDYSNCVSGNAIQSYNDGKTSIPLTKPGPLYFICGTPGHCPGMQLQINVQSATSTGGSSTTPATTTSPSSSSTPSGKTPSYTTPSTESSGAAGGLNSLSGLIFGLGTLFAFIG